MKIALIGYGKMGKMIEKIALGRGNEISCRIDKENPEDFGSEEFLGSDVAIEFTTPSTAAANIAECFRAGIPVVCGTTGWVNETGASGKTLLEEARDRCEAGEGTLLWASNFSIGVNIFMAVNRYLARIMESFADYTPSMTETHHIHKLDHPSGTAISLALQIEENNSRVTGWAEPEEGKAPQAGILEISHVREGEVPGIHTIVWDSPTDDITITHSAKSRQGFALGAVMAAEWLAGKKGFRTLPEMLAEITRQDIFK
ncbi:MAG: 4-hydroxy-tetrahydrodipicolinate reductase [Muribaculaceae bacterium]|nr:4-hydroxy-tetrahydrodipicolinate reductase [Muribaculaceae bacterium]